VLGHGGAVRAQAPLLRAAAAAHRRIARHVTARRGDLGARTTSQPGTAPPGTGDRTGHPASVPAPEGAA
jgi:hypothetical protein